MGSGQSKGNSKCDCDRDCNKPPVEQPISLSINSDIDNGELDTNDIYIDDRNNSHVKLIKDNVYLIKYNGTNNFTIKSYQAKYKGLTQDTLVFEDVKEYFYKNGNRTVDTSGKPESIDRNSLTIHRASIGEYYIFDYTDIYKKLNKGGKKSRKHLKRKRKSKKKSIDS